MAFLARINFFLSINNIHYYIAATQQHASYINKSFLLLNFVLNALVALYFWKFRLGASTDDDIHTAVCRASFSMYLQYFSARNQVSRKNKLYVSSCRVGGVCHRP